MLFAHRPSSPLVRAVSACRWSFPSTPMRATALREFKLPQLDAPIELFEDADDPALLAVNWQPERALPLAWPLDFSGAPDPAWCAEADIVARWSARRDDAPACLVVVRQPFTLATREAQCDWVATVLRALESDAEPPAGLLTANFFASRDGALVLNLAEWTSADAHREALKRGSYGQHGSIGSSPQWKATREHPAISREHEVHRYLPIDRTERRI